MRVCSICGEKNEDWMNICQRCGNSIVNAYDTEDDNSYEVQNNDTYYEQNSNSYEATTNQVEYNNVNYSNNYIEKKETTKIKKPIYNLDLKIIIVILLLIFICLLTYTIFVVFVK